MNTQSPPPLRFAGRLVKILMPPVLLFVAGAGLLVFLGMMQRRGWLQSEGSAASAASVAADVDYICPMMCVPPVHEPGRCPVCSMELVPATSAGAGGDERSIVVDAAARRIAGIRTDYVRSRPVMRTIRAVGEIHYNEGNLRTITAWHSGRIVDLYVDYTGAVVREGDRLAGLYAPQLYAAQAEYLQALGGAAEESRLPAVAEARRVLRENSRRKLVEFGMTEAQIARLEADRTADSRVDIFAPLSGTVIDRMATEGSTVEEGESLFRLADLSSVWLVLDLYPEDAAAVRYGQSVSAVVDSMPQKNLVGRVAFIDPDVRPESRTVRVRIVMDNQDGKLRIGDFAAAEIRVPVGATADGMVFDPELADKWISPRHPHIIRDSPGQCPLCDEPLVAAAELGFANRPTEEADSLVIPRNALLSAAGNSLVYVEEEPGRFAIRRVRTGPRVGDEVVITRGLADGEVVAVGGSFLIDSQMQLAGNPSLIDPYRALPPMEMVPGFDPVMIAAIRQLPESDQDSALEQVICPVTNQKLGSMGVPPRAFVRDREIYLCCEGCRERLMQSPESYMARLDAHAAGSTDTSRMPPVPPSEETSAVPKPDGDGKTLPQR